MSCSVTTLCADVRFFTCVYHAFMGGEVATLRKALVTVSAGEGFLLGMSAHVGGELRRLCEGFRTDGADKGLLLSMSSRMPLQGTISFKSLITRVTFIRPVLRMRNHMLV